MEYRIEHIKKQYQKGKWALRDVNMVLTEGVYGILGPNGAGKSTLMNIMTCNLLPDSGRILLDGEDIVDMGNRYRDLIGYVPQQQTLYNNFSGFEFLDYFAALKGLNRKERRKKIQELLQVTNLKEVQYQKVGSYSGGMKQRILLAQALLNDPQLLILDEPTAGLDPKERMRLRMLISKIGRNKIVLFATHVVSDVENIAKEIIMIKDGKIVCLDTPAKIIEKMQGGVYEVLLNELEMESFLESHQVGNLRMDQNGIWARVLLPAPPEDRVWIEQKPTLEDIYLSHFHMVD